MPRMRPPSGPRASSTRKRRGPAKHHEEDIYAHLPLPPASGSCRPDARGARLLAWPLCFYYPAALFKRGTPKNDRRVQWRSYLKQPWQREKAVRKRKIIMTMRLVDALDPDTPSYDKIIDAVMSNLEECFTGIPVSE